MIGGFGLELSLRFVLFIHIVRDGGRNWYLDFGSLLMCWGI